MRITRIPAPWLLLVFTLPVKRSSQRVEVWRKLQRYGALPLRHSGYLLPNSPANREHFEWLAEAIRKYSGEASVVEVQSIDNLPTERLVGRFAEARARDYQGVIRELHKLASASPSTRAAGRLTRLRRRFQEIVAIDFFGSPLRARAEELLETMSSPRAASSSVGGAQKATKVEYRGRLWVTRPRPGVDRVSSAWLIRRFIDPKARFTFAPDGHAPRGAVPFDMYHGGFGHRGEDCTFETLQKQFHLRNRKVSALAQMVHDADLGDEKFGRKEGFGIDAVMIGWASQGIPDRELLKRGMELIEGLYRSIR